MISNDAALKDLPKLRESLDLIRCNHLGDQLLIGRAISYLVILEDIFKEKQKEKE